MHFAEQRAAPYSMKSPGHKRYTVDNNVNATHNLVTALVESGLDAHVVHLGTMGVYGYGGGLTIPEGYLRVRVEAADGADVEREILHPTDPGSVYHLTKTIDQLIFAYFNKNDAIRVTDLHQGIVWGTQTPETRRDERLVNRFDYDGDYGTVLNRFLMQAAVGHPLTVHGTGGQTRAFIHIQDTVRCIQLAIEHPPQAGERVRIFNQMTEVHRVIDLAELVARVTGARIELVDNPRNEAPENLLAAREPQPARPGARPDPARGRPAARGHGGRPALPRPLRRRQDPVPLALGAAAGAGAARRPGELARADRSPAAAVRHDLPAVRLEHLSAGGNRRVRAGAAIHERDLGARAVARGDVGKVGPELPRKRRLLEPRGHRGAAGQHGFRTTGEVDRGGEVAVALGLTCDRAGVGAKQPELAHAETRGRERRRSRRPPEADVSRRRRARSRVPCRSRRGSRRVRRA